MSHISFSSHIKAFFVLSKFPFFGPQLATENKYFHSETYLSETESEDPGN